MGALSSWAMLALTHHVIVQIASMRVGKPSFTNYALLGDDIVIADKAVAMSYHEIMTKILVNPRECQLVVPTFSFWGCEGTTAWH